MSVGLDETLPDEATEGTEAAAGGDLDQTADPSVGEGTEPAETEPEDAGASQEGNTSEEEAPAENPSDLREYMQQTHGRDYLQRFGSDAALLQHFDHADQMIGRRNEEAAFGKMVRGRQDVMDLLQGKKPESEEPEKPEKPRRLSREELLYLQQQVIDPETRQPRADADPQRVALWKKIEQTSGQNINEFGQDPDAFLESRIAPMLDKVRAQATEEAQRVIGQQQAADQYNTQLDTFEQDNAWLYSDGKLPPQGTPPEQIVFSPAGNAFRTEFQKQHQQFGTIVGADGNVVRSGLNQLQVMQYTLQLMQAETAGKRQPTMPTKRAAKRKANAAAPAPGPAPDSETFTAKMERKNNERLAAEQAMK